MDGRRISLSWTALLIAVGCFPTLVLSQPVYFAGTGHYYEVVSSDVGYERYYAGEWAGRTDCYLATITSSEENVFVAGLLVPGEVYWLGGRQYPDSVEPDGGWYWDNGEAWGYSNWVGGAPSNPKWLTVTHQAGSPNANLAGWIIGGNGLGGVSEFSILLGNEPAIGPVVFQDGVEYSLNEVATMINDHSRATRGYNCAGITYDSYLNLYYLRIRAEDPGMGDVWIQGDQGDMDDADFAGGFLEGDHLTISGSTGLWQETYSSFPGAEIGFVVEYTVPEPGVLALLVCAGSAGLIHRSRRSRQV
ncbi:MAG: C-type lectin-like domain-containing protein [Planctomycetota bacterium]|jgi:hypothetical protein